MSAGPTAQSDADPAARLRNARAAAVDELLSALDNVVRHHRGPHRDSDLDAEHARADRYSADAERITGEVARHLNAARVRLAALPLPMSRPGG